MCSGAWWKALSIHSLKVAFLLHVFVSLGGGPSKPKNEDAHINRVIGLIQPVCDGLINIFDSDAVLNKQNGNGLLLCLY